MARHLAQIQDLHSGGSTLLARRRRMVSFDRLVAKRRSCKEGNILVAREAKVLSILYGMRVYNVVTEAALLLARSHQYK